MYGPTFDRIDFPAGAYLQLGTCRSQVVVGGGLQICLSTQLVVVIECVVVRAVVVVVVVGVSGVTGGDASDGELAPTAFTAVTLNL
jgi:hypothetical protein